jgi:hypothetical protein
MTCMIIYFRSQSVQLIQLYARRTFLPRKARVAIPFRNARLLFCQGYLQDSVIIEKSSRIKMQSIMRANSALH